MDLTSQRPLPELLGIPNRLVLFLRRPGLIAQSLCHALCSAGIESESRIYEGNHVEIASTKFIIIFAEDSASLFPLLSLHVDKGITALVVVDRVDLKLTQELIRQGAAGVLSTNESIHIMIAAIHLAAVGGIFVPKEIARSTCRRDPLEDAPGATIETGIADKTGEAGAFTCRERDIIERLRRGLQNKIIAYDLGISENTVKVHLHNIMKKLQARNRTEVVFMLNGDGCSP